MGWLRALAVSVLLIAGCTSPPRYVPSDDPNQPAELDPSEALELIQADAVQQWCRAEVEGEPILDDDWPERLGCQRWRP